MPGAGTATTTPTTTFCPGKAAPGAAQHGTGWGKRTEGQARHRRHGLPLLPGLSYSPCPVTVPKQLRRQACRQGHPYSEPLGTFPWNLLAPESCSFGA